MNAGLAASVHARLLAGAKRRSEDFNLTLTRYALERFLYRLSISEARNRFLLKGALLFQLWFDEPHRPTRDIDFLGLGPSDPDQVRDVIAGICAVAADDGMRFDPQSIAIEEIREEAHYGGTRIKLVGYLDKARCVVQVDVGFGDAVTPGPEAIVYPTLLDDMPAPHLKAYPRATVVAEKLEAIVILGMTNSRMKDYFDILALTREGAIDPSQLTKAVVATFARRRTLLPHELPIGLSDEFANDAIKRAQWAGFLRRNRLTAPDLADVVSEVRSFVGPSLKLGK